MNTKVSVRRCADYEIQEVYGLVNEIWNTCGAPDVAGKKVLVKPNILNDRDPSRAISTHPVVVEAVVKMLQSLGANVVVGDSPSIHMRSMKPEKSGIYQVCHRRGVEWIDFMRDPSEISLRNGKIRIASVINEVDLIVSVPKFKNHELMYFTGAIKNTLGLVPGFTKAKQHALHNDRLSFSEFLVTLNEAVLPDFFIMDGITGMEGPGPAQGSPRNIGLLLGSANPVALDIVASKIAGYDPLAIQTSAIAIKRGKWLKDVEEIIYDGPELKSLIIKDFKRIPVKGNENISVKFIKNRLPFLRKFDRRPVFLHNKCTGCLECIKICPANAIMMDQEKENHVNLTDSKCIRCFCCSEVCQYNAIEVQRKLVGV